MSEAMEHDLRYKTVLCHNWTGAAGSCVRGERCAFAHGEAERRQMPRAAAMKALAESGGSMLVSELFGKLYAVCNKDAAKADIKAAGGSIKWCESIGLHFSVPHFGGETVSLSRQLAELEPAPTAEAAPSAESPVLTAEAAANATLDLALLLQQPEASGSTLGKDKATWAEMSESEQVAARVLGFAAELWDEGLTPESSFQPFHLLRAELRAAAEILGYTEASWNAELSDVKGGEEEAEAARPAAATWAEESPLTLDARRLRAAFERDPALWDDLARLVVRVESALK